MPLERELTAASVDAQRIYEKRFYAATPRSEAYRRGFLNGLRKKLDHYDGITFPYDIGTAEADAFWAGEDTVKEYLEVRGHGA